MDMVFCIYATLGNGKSIDVYLKARNAVDAMRKFSANHGVPQNAEIYYDLDDGKLHGGWHFDGTKYNNK